MRTGVRITRRRAAAAAPALLVCLLAACATMEPPQGGPVDKTPPEVVAFSPDSGAVGLTGLDRIEIVFSEKVDPAPSTRFVHFYPDLDVKSTKWSSRRKATITFHDPLPADTVIVVEIAKGHSDVHRVRSVVSRRYPLSTGAALPEGVISGRLVFGEDPAVGAVIELYPVPPDSLEYFQQDILRRTEADSSGWFEFPWLPVPGGPYLLRAFVDNSEDLRPAESEPQRLLPLKAVLTVDSMHVDIGLHVVFSPQTPGRLLGLLDGADSTRTLFGWAETVAEADTGFVPSHTTRTPSGQAAVTAGDTAIFDPAGPGDIRAVIFADLDGDSLLSALPDSLSMPDSVLWHWEPYATVDTLTVEPGLDLFAVLPLPGDSLRVCATPPPLMTSQPDTSIAAALSDSATAGPDSLSIPAVPDTTLIGKGVSP